MRSASIILFILSSFHFANVVSAQSQEKVYALLMLSFAKGIQWPDLPSGQKFTIGVLEYPPLAAELTTSVGSSKIGTHTVEIKEFAHADEVSNCQIIFIPAYKARQLAQVVNKLGKSSVLIVTNKTDLIQKGSDVNFVLVDGKLRYEVNCKRIEARGMKISSTVRGRGIVVDL
ncbi:YfiR family protein [Pseudochryseolinea flava]|uniref:YfiR family protein n=1 Tax=Pseudochryseolinea flava TaxID=2059302 RepID=A0A364XUT6_9BACT|nr:YfiR family protein [Pseudochryseolinea flava]RAV97934.1 hypothetical protein DQQ10_26035 [Pseudochryseolinea flava]